MYYHCCVGGKKGEHNRSSAEKRARQANKTPKRNPVLGQKDHFGT